MQEVTLRIAPAVKKIDDDHCGGKHRVKAGLRELKQTKTGTNVARKMSDDEGNDEENTLAAMEKHTQAQSVPPR